MSPIRFMGMLVRVTAKMRTASFGGRWYMARTSADASRKGLSYV